MLNFFNHLDPYMFIIAFAVGIFFCYITYPPPEYIIKHPTPENADHTIYRDDSDNCFKYKAEEVQCPNDKSKIKDTPINIS